MEQVNQHVSEKVSSSSYRSKRIFVGVFIGLLVTILSGLIGYLVGVRTGNSAKNQLTSQPIYFPPTATLYSTNSPGSPVPFDTFLQQVAQAKYSDYAQLPTTKVQNAQAFEEMRTYTLNLYAGKQAISTYTINGQILLPDPGSPSTVQPH